MKKLILCATNAGKEVADSVERYAKNAGLLLERRIVTASPLTPSPYIVFLDNTPTVAGLDECMEYIRKTAKEVA